MRIVVIGAVEFSRSALSRLIAIDADIVGVITLAAAPFNNDHVDLTPLCEERGIPCAYGPDINSDETVSWVAARQPNVLFCFGWSRLLRERLLKLAPLGAVGFHPSALPANRGRHPLIWALALGLTETASTFFFLGEGTDDGDILSQERVPIHPSDDAGSLYRNVTRCALRQIDAFVPQLEAGTFVRRPQDHRLANTWRKRSKADGEIDWRMSSATIHDLVRALAKPYPGAHFMHAGKEVKVWKTEVVDGGPRNMEPGRVIAMDGASPTVKCGVNAIRLTCTEPPVAPAVGTCL